MRHGGRRGDRYGRRTASGSGRESRRARGWREDGRGSNAIVGSSVPVGFWVAQTFAHRDTCVALLDHQVKHVTCHVVNSLVMNVVANGEELISRRVAGVKGSLDSIFRDLCRLGSDVVVIY